MRNDPSGGRLSGLRSSVPMGRGPHSVPVLSSLLAGLCSVLVTPDGALSAEAQARELNILFILSDQYRWDCVGAAGKRSVHTPHLDRLAKEGTLFNRAYTAQPVCSPNRASIVTGLYPHSAGVQDNCTGGGDGERSLPKSSRTMSEMLAPAGFDCGYFGKWHLGRRDAFKTFPEYPSDGRGDNHYFGKGDTRRYGVDVITEDAIAFLRRERSQPFYVYVSFYPPHPPFSVPPEYLERYQDVGNQEERTYYAMCTKIDEKVGDLLKAVDDLGIANRTLVVFTSDHGHNFVRRWNDHQKRLCYDSAARVPLLMRWPGAIRSGRVTDGLISSVDLTPTILGLAGQPIPAGLQGQDLSTLARGQTDKGRDCVFIENVPYPFKPDKGEERCVFDGRWKLILSSRRAPELYDLKSDADEVTNHWEKMAASEPATRLVRLLAAWAHETKDELAPHLIAALSPQSRNATP